MNKITKKIIAYFLVLTLMLTSTDTLYALGADKKTNAKSDITTKNLNVLGTNSIGTLLAKEISEELENDTEISSKITDIRIDNNKIIVSYQVIEDASVIVAIFDEKGEQLLTSVSSSVSATEDSVEIMIEQKDLPEYFFIRGYLIDNDNGPLCVPYESELYTEDMQKLLSSTIDDYDETRIYNLDENRDNNFAVYNESVSVIKSDATVNCLLSVDESSHTYIIDNADSSLTALESGDLMALEQDSGEVLIACIDDMNVEDNTVTIIGQDISLDKVFDYIKIDTQAGMDKVDIDAASCADGVEYCGLTEETETAKNTTKLNNAEENYVEMNQYKTGGYSKEYSAKYKLMEKGVFSGDMQFKLGVSLEFYISLKKQYIKLDISYEMGLALKMEIKGKSVSKPLARFGYALAPGVYVEITPCFIMEAAVTGEFDVKLKGNFGISVDNGKINNISKWPKLDTKLKLEGSLAIGVSLEPKVKVISEKIAEVSMEAKVVGKVKAIIVSDEIPEHTIHPCTQCLDGDITANATIKATVKVLNRKKWTYEYKLLDFEIKLGDFYYSCDTDELGLGTCPHILYKVVVCVKDKNDEPIKNAKVQYRSITGTTNAKGKYSFYIENGKHNITISKSEMKVKKKTVTVNGKPRNLNVKLSYDAVVPRQPISAGCIHSVAIDENGRLYAWGNNSCAELGDGTRITRYSPAPIMKDVEAVCADMASTAAITKDSSLYIWGQIADHSTTKDCGSNKDFIHYKKPTYIMNNIVSVSCGPYMFAAVTKDGKLYTWGHNVYGELGNGTDNCADIPVHIMDNIAMVSCGWSQTAAVTKDGKLYTWGCNYDGELGCGLAYDICKNSPSYVMDNIAMVSCGASHTAAVTKDGKLYIWGYGGRGELGNGRDDSSNMSNIPVHVMDNISSVDCGLMNVLAVTTDNKLYGWGFNENGQISGLLDKRVLKPTFLMSDIVAASAGEHHSMALSVYGNLYVWGSNEWGQLGTGDEEDRIIPQITLSNIMLPNSVKKKTMLSALAEKNLSDVENSTDLIVDQYCSFISEQTGCEEISSLKKNTPYMYYMLKTDETEDLFSTDNILYIAYGITDEDGDIAFDYFMREDYKNPVVMLVEEASGDVFAEDDNPSETDNADEGILVSGIQFAESHLTLKTGQVYTQSVTVLPDNAGNKRLMWDTDNTSVINVDLAGNITALSPGNASVRVTSVDGSGTSASFEVTVSKNGEEEQESSSVEQTEDKIKESEETHTTDKKSPAKKGTVFKDKKSKGKYVVTSSNKKSPTVAYKGTTDKKAKVISIPASISVDGIRYKVTDIKEKALKGNAKITKLLVGKNVRKICNSACENCKKLKTVIVVLRPSQLDM